MHFSSFGILLNARNNRDIAVNAGLVIPTAIDRQFHINAHISRLPFPSSVMGGISGVV